MKRMCFSWKRLIACGLTLGGLSLTGQDPDAARAEITEWIGIQKTLSKERAEWSVEQAVIEDMIRVLEQEQEDLQSRIELGREAVSAADEERAELEDERESLRAATGTVESLLPAIEESIRGLHDRFPPPLQDTVAQLYNRLRDPAATEQLSLSQRLMAIVGILSQADKFNSVVTEVSENRTIGGQNVIVRILYFGTGGAIYADPEGAVAGFLYPTADGWVEEQTPDQAGAILAAMDVYANRSEAEFVNIPVNLQ